MGNLSIGQKIILHLDRYKMTDPNDIYNIPWDLTQDGIATSLRISRAHASIELKKLREKDYVEEKQTHIKGGKVKRKSYLLTPIGMDDANQIKDYAAKEGIDINALLDLKRQNATVLLEELSEEDMHALGCACAFRIPVPLEILPRAKKSVVPIDVTGKTVIDEILRNNVLSAASPENKSHWHSYVADYWLNDKEILDDNIERTHERLYHLVEAGRNKEACRLVSNDMYDLIYTANDDLHDTLSKITNIPERQAVDVLSVKIEVALLSNDIISARNDTKTLAEFDNELSRLYSASIEINNDRMREALEILSTLDDKSALVELRIAEALIKQGKYDEAKNILNTINLKGTNPSTGVDKFILLARIDKYQGHDDDAMIRLTKAKASVPDKGKKRIDNIIKELNLKK